MGFCPGFIYIYIYIYIYIIYIYIYCLYTIIPSIVRLIENICLKCLFILYAFTDIDGMLNNNNKESFCFILHPNISVQSDRNDLNI